MYEFYESFNGVLIDAIIVFIFFISLVIGWRRYVLESVIDLGIQLFSLYSAYKVADNVTLRVMSFIPENFELSSYLPQEFQLFFEPYEPNVLRLLLQAITFIVVFIIIKSFLWHFGQTYLCQADTQSTRGFKSIVCNSLSSGATLLTTYTYLMFVIILIGIPGLGVIPKQSFANQLIEQIPIFSNQVQLMYTKSEAVEDVMMTYGRATCETTEEQAVCLKDIILSVSLNESKWEDHIEPLATPIGYLQFFNESIITEVAMLNHVNELTLAIESNVMTKEFINLYYKELIDNKTYDKLVKNQIVIKPSIYVLLHSGLLNNENYNSLEEYL